MKGGGCLTFEEMEEMELKYLKELLCLYGFSANISILNEICNFIHTSLFDYKRCKKLIFDGVYLEYVYKNKLSQSTLKHFVKTNDKYLLTYSLKSKFNKEKDDVEYILSVLFDQSQFLKHEISAVNIVCNMFIEDLNNVRFEARKYYGPMWRKEVKQQKQSKEELNHV